MEEGATLVAETCNNIPTILDLQIYEEIGEEAILVLFNEFVHFTAVDFSGTNTRNEKVYNFRSAFVSSSRSPNLSDLYRRQMAARSCCKARP